MKVVKVKVLKVKVKAVKVKVVKVKVVKVKAQVKVEGKVKVKVIGGLGGTFWKYILGDTLWEHILEAACRNTGWTSGLCRGKGSLKVGKVEARVKVKRESGRESESYSDSQSFNGKHE